MYQVKFQIIGGELDGSTFVDKTDIPYVPGRVYRSHARNGASYICLIRRPLFA